MLKSTQKYILILIILPIILRGQVNDIKLYNAQINSTQLTYLGSTQYALSITNKGSNAIPIISEDPLELKVVVFKSQLTDHANPEDYIGSFDLQTYTQNIILEHLDTSNFVANFHYYQGAAELNIYPLPNDYVNEINNQIIYARVFNAIANTVEIKHLLLEVKSKLQLSTIENMVQEDIDADGITVFDLTKKIQEIITLNVSKLEAAIYIHEIQWNNIKNIKQSVS